MVSVPDQLILPNSEQLFRKKSESIETKEFISDLLLTQNYCDKYKESSVLFSVEKRLSFYILKYATVLVVLSFFLFVVKLSEIITLILVLFLFFAFLVKFTSIVKRESAYLLVPLGLQLSSVFLFGTKTSTFIPWSAVQDFVIVEVINRQTVIYCLVVLVEDTNGISYVTLFEHTKPKLKVLERVYKTFQTILISQRKKDSNL